MQFIGSHVHTLDSKNRLAIPAVFRTLVQRELGLGEDDPIAFQLTVSERPDALSLYTDQTFKDYLELMRSPAVDIDLVLKVEDQVLRRTQPVETDRQGRILLPDRLLRHRPMPKEVQLTGMSDYIEIAPAASAEDEGPIEGFNLRRALPKGATVN